MVPALLLSLTVTGARAQDPAPEPTAEDPTPETPASNPRAVELFENGKQLFDEANYDAAVIAWTESYKLSQEPLLLFNIASAQERLGELDDAIVNLNKYRAFAPTEEHEALERRVRNLERLRDAQAAPKPVPVPVPTEVPPAPKSSNTTRLIGGTLLGVGGAGVVTGAVLGLAASGANSRAGDSCIDGLCLQDAKDPLASAHGLALGSDIAWIGGVATAVAGTSVLLFVHPKATTVSVGLGHVSFSGRF